MLTKKWMDILERDKKIYELYMKDTDRTEMSNMFGISKSNICYSVRVYEKHMRAYEDKNNYIYRKLFDNTEFELAMQSLNRIANTVMFNYKKEADLIRALNNGSICKIKGFGRSRTFIPILKLLYEIE